MAGEIAYGLNQYLRNQGIDSTIATTGSTPVLAGEHLEESILGSIEACDLVVAVLTDESAESICAQDELQFAYANRKPIIPFVSVSTRSKLPKILQSRLRIDFDLSNPEDRFERILHDIGAYEQRLASKERIFGDSILTVSKRFRIRELVECLDACQDGYSRASYAQACTTPVAFDSNLHSALSFVQCGMRVRIPRGWFEDPLVDSSFAFMQLGIEVACAEARFIVSTLNGSVAESVSMGRLSPESLSRLVSAVSGPRTDLTLLAPISHYVQIHGWQNNGKGSPMVTYEDPETSFLDIANTRIRLLWSNSSIPFDDFMLISRTALEFVAKVDDQTRRGIEVFVCDHPSDKEALIAEATTSINLTVTNSSKIVIGRLSG